MRLAIVSLVALMLMGCFSIYDIQPGAIVQYNAPSPPPPLVDAETGERAASDEPGGENQTTQAGGGNMNTVNIGGKNTAETDMAASLEATLRDLITGNPVN